MLMQSADPAALSFDRLFEPRSVVVLTALHTAFGYSIPLTGDPKAREIPSENVPFRQLPTKT